MIIPPHIHPRVDRSVLVKESVHPARVLNILCVRVLRTPWYNALASVWIGQRRTPRQKKKKLNHIETKPHFLYITSRSAASALQVIELMTTIMITTLLSSNNIFLKTGSTLYYK